MRRINAIFVASMIFVLLGCTREITVPRVEIVSSSSSSLLGSINVNAKVNDDGGELLDAGVCYIMNTNRLPTIEDKKRSVGAKDRYSTSLTNLSKGTYRVRAYATNRAGTAYSECLTFHITLLPDLPTVELVSVEKDSYYYNYRLTGKLINNGGENVSAKGFEISWIHPRYGGDTTVLSTEYIDATNGFTAGYNNFYSGYYYKIRAYAENRAGKGFSAPKILHP